MCAVELVESESAWKHSIIYPWFVMHLFTCMAEICLDKAEIVRNTATNIPRSPREDGFDQRAIDSIKARMVRPRASGILSVTGSSPSRQNRRAPT